MVWLGAAHHPVRYCIWIFANDFVRIFSRVSFAWETGLLLAFLTIPEPHHCTNTSSWQNVLLSESLESDQYLYIHLHLPFSLI